MPKIISDELYARLVKMAEAHVTDEELAAVWYEDAVTCGNFDDCYDTAFERGMSALAHDIVEEITDA
jgi:hypothetical protein